MKRAIAYGFAVLSVCFAVPVQAQNFQQPLEVHSNFPGGGPTLTVENRNLVGDVAIDFLSAGDLLGNVAAIREEDNPPNRFVVLQNNESELPLTLSEQGLGHVGVGISDPQAPLHVRSHFEGGGATLLVDNEQEPGSSDIAIDFAAGGEYLANIALTDLRTVNARMMVLQNNPENLNLTLLEEGGYVGIGTMSPVYPLEVNGVVGAVDFMQLSDAKLKRHVQTISDALDKVSSLRGVNFEWRTDEVKDRKLTAGTHIGVIAQEVETTVPELVVTSADGYKSVAYSSLTALLIEALKELREQNDLLAGRVASLEASLQQ